jgi:hypothetical protein
VSTNRISQRVRPSGTVNVTDAEHHAFRVYHGTVDDDGNFQLGPTLRQAKFARGITVEEASDSKRVGHPVTQEQHATEEVPTPQPPIDEEAK